jgi:hypothetical protein
MIGTEGAAFRQIARQLDYERSGPERFLTTMPLLRALLERARRDEVVRWAPEIGALVARVSSLRAMSMSIAQSMDAGLPPSAGAALVKDLGASFDLDVVALAGEIVDDLDPADRSEFDARLREALLFQPSFTLRGGTTEVLRGIVARRMLGLGRAL